MAILSLFEALRDDSSIARACALGVALISLFALAAIKRTRSTLPTINNYPNDWNNTRAKAEYQRNARGLVQAGSQKYGNRPFRVITELSDMIVMPHSYLDWAKTHPDLDHQAQVAQEFFGDFPGFEGIGAFNHPDQFIIELVKKKMSTVTPAFVDQFKERADRILANAFTDSGEWHTADWPAVSRNLIASLSSSVFVGSRLAAKPEWQALTTKYTLSLFHGARALRSWPKPLRPLIHWFLKDCKACRSHMAEARSLLASFSIGDEERDTALSWSKDNVDPDVAAIQLALGLGAIHTTSQLLQQSLLDLALAHSTRPALLTDLRNEIDASLGSSDGKLLPSTLSRLTLLDACIKESQRLKPGNVVNIDRAALKPVTLPDGTIIPKGAQICFASDAQWSEEAWGLDAGRWNPDRFLQPDSQKDTRAVAKRPGLVSSTNHHFTFGLGRFICPGRFFAAAELKVILARILDGWEVRLGAEDVKKIVEEGKGRIESKDFGFEMLTDDSIRVEVRKRK